MQRVSAFTRRAVCLFFAGVLLILSTSSAGPQSAWPMGFIGGRMKMKGDVKTDATVEITADDLQDMVDVLADCDYGQPEGSPLQVRLGPYGYRWLRRKQQLFG